MNTSSLQAVSFHFADVSEHQESKMPRRFRKPYQYFNPFSLVLASWHLGVRVSSGGSKLLLFAVALTLVWGCRKEDMANQPKYEPHQSSAFFEDGNSARPLVEGTVSRSGGQSDAYEFDRTAHSTTAPSTAAQVTVNAGYPADFPQSGEPLRRQLERGQERYNIYCAVCHGQTGAGDGMIVQRGFIRPPSFYPLASDVESNPDLYRRSQNLLTVSPGYVYDKITNGYGAMYSYAARVAPADRWAIAAYIRVLQLSQVLPRSELTSSEQESLDAVSKGVVKP